MEWTTETLSEVTGKAGLLEVVIRNLPCRKASDGARRRYPYPDFGADFRAEFMDRQLSDFGSVAARLNQGEVLHASVVLRDLPGITVEVRGRACQRPRQFFSELGDALIDAFTRHGIKP